MADRDYTIKVVTLGDPSGSDRVATSLDRVSKSAKGTGTEAKDAGNAIDAFGKKGAAAQDAFEGLSRVANGGAGAIFGMAKAARALGEAFVANPVTAALGLVLALLPLIQKGFDLMVSSAEKARDAMAGTGEQVRSAQTNIESLAKASAEKMKSVERDAANTRAEFTRLNSEIDGALRRFKEVEEASLAAKIAANNLEREKALSGAKTDEERAAIGAKFDAIDAQDKASSDRKIGDKELLSITQKGIAADAARANAEGAINSASASTAAARDAMEKARRSGDVKAFGNALRTYESASADEKKIRATNEPILNDAINQQKDVEASSKVFGLREQQTRSERATSTLTTARGTATSVSGNNPRIAELRRTAEEAQARGDFGGQSRAVAELNSLKKANGDLVKAVVDFGATTKTTYKAATKQIEKNERQMKATKESKAGG